MSKVFEGKVILITGASRGIGRAVAISFARAGASGIVLGARTEDDLQGTEDAILGTLARAGEDRINENEISKPPTPTVLKVILDITNENSVSAAVSFVKTIFGRLDVLVNNAGYYPTPTPIASSEPSEWWKTFTTNVFGPYLVTRSCLPLLISSNNGSKIVINVASWGAHNVTVGSSAYEVSLDKDSLNPLLLTASCIKTSTEHANNSDSHRSPLASNQHLLQPPRFYLQIRLQNLPCCG